jgi:hypothetical protein
MWITLATSVISAGLPPIVSAVVERWRYRRKHGKTAEHAGTEDDQRRGKGSEGAHEGAVEE